MDLSLSTKEPTIIMSNDDNNKNHNDANNNHNTTATSNSTMTMAPTKKRKADVVVDSLSRVAGSSSETIGKQSGRGSLAGWTVCPLCSDISKNKKKYSIGRGIASHLEAIHTPWKPSKLAIKIQRRRQEREARKVLRLQQQQLEKNNNKNEKNQQQQQKQLLQDTSMTTTTTILRTEPWEPTQQEVDEWNQKILEICKETEEAQKAVAKSSSSSDKNSDTTMTMKEEEGGKSSDLFLDRTGRPVKRYKESLPPFLEAASKGDLQSLQRIVKEKQEEAANNEIADADGRYCNTSNSIAALLNTKDRHMSTADHWAAGSGSLECLKYILELRRKHVKVTTTTCTTKDQGDTTISVKKPRRRDGKTCLHYAARNGHLECIRYLLEDDVVVKNDNFKVDEVSGEGSTPLHMACYGGHPKVVKYLVSKGADPCKANEWGCTAAHWVAMTISSSTADVRELCTFLFKIHGVSFVEAQNQGHTALHKAAHRRNEHVIRWLADDEGAVDGEGSGDGGAGLSELDKKRAGQPDLGGHKPSAIWRSVGGSADFGDWMESMGW